MRPLAAACLLALAACTIAEGNAGTRFVIDSTASGVPRVISSAPNGWRDSTEAWTLAPADTFAGPEGSPAALVSPQSLAVDGGGRVYVADRKPATIKVFAPDGRMIRTIGRDGEGPGEFRTAFIAAWKDRLVVHDPQSSRTTVFDTSGTFLKTWHSACCYWTSITIDDSGRIYVPTPAFDQATRDRGQPWVRFAMNGDVVDTLWLPIRDEQGKTWTVRAGSGQHRMMMQMSVPFTPVFRETFLPSGGFAYGWSEAYRLVLSPHGRDTVRVFGRDWTADPIPDALRQAAVDRAAKNLGDQIDKATIESVIKIADVPTSAPAFMTLHADHDGNVWARQLVSSDSTRTTWDVFDPRGVWLGEVAAPSAIPEDGPTYFGRGELYASVEDELGRPVVVRFRLTR
jgi:6-bladed beta-propeller